MKEFEPPTMIGSLSWPKMVSMASDDMLLKFGAVKSALGFSIPSKWWGTPRCSSLVILEKGRQVDGQPGLSCTCCPHYDHHLVFLTPRIKDQDTRVEAKVVKRDKVDMRSNVIKVVVSPSEYEKCWTRQPEGVFAKR
ncbi:hypothetical protein PanWU01x14_115240 [Parasponia andersonii]|uniref:Uncharacterized protein n=1 Tax=Parasponia andersonii TaxID=3476 RepID=A0A2P5CXN1_PARAD|nr:hypothetical protein PanWU01x14_115240 [Parasponia andersonii]